MERLDLDELFDPGNFQKSFSSGMWKCVEQRENKHDFSVFLTTQREKNRFEPMWKCLTTLLRDNSKSNENKLSCREKFYKFPRQSETLFPTKEKSTMENHTKYSTLADVKKSGE